MDDLPEGPVVERDGLVSPLAGCAVSFFGLIAWAIGATLLQLAFSWAKGNTYNDSAGLPLIEFIFAFLFCSLVWRLVKGRYSIDSVGLRPIAGSGKDWILGLLFGLAGAGAAIGIIALSGGIKFEIAGSPVKANDTSIGPIGWFAATVIFILAAGQEEIVGRGFLFPLIKRSIGFWWALILSSLAFSSLHILNPAFSPVSAFDIFLAGIFLALLRELTGDLYLAWGAHFGWNFGLIAAGLPVSGFMVQLLPKGLHAIDRGPSWLTGGSFGPEGGLAGIMADLMMIAVAAWLLSRRKAKKTTQSTPPFV